MGPCFGPSSQNMVVLWQRHGISIVILKDSKPRPVGASLEDRDLREAIILKDYLTKLFTRVRRSTRLGGDSILPSCQSMGTSVTSRADSDRDAVDVFFNAAIKKRKKAMAFRFFDVDS